MSRFAANVVALDNRMTTCKRAAIVGNVDPTFRKSLGDLEFELPTVELAVTQKAATDFFGNKYQKK